MLLYYTYLKGGVTLKKFQYILLLLIMSCILCFATAYAEGEQAQVTQEPAQTEKARLLDNQINVPENAVSVIFTIKHKQFVNITLTNPSGIILQSDDPSITITSLSDGTKVTVKNPSVGLWTANVSSDMGEELRVLSECGYDIKVTIQSETNIIYNGVANKYYVDITALDGSKLDDNLVKTATVKLLINESGKSDYLDLSFANARFGGSYTCRRIGKVTISAIASIKNNTISVKSEPIEMIAITDPNAKREIPMWFIIPLVIIATTVIIVSLIKYNDRMKKTKGVKNMSGVLKLEVSVGGINRLPIHRNLSTVGLNANIRDVIGDDEFFQVEDIKIAGTKNGILVINNSDCSVRFSNISADPNGVEIKDKQFFKITTPDNRIHITVTYSNDDTTTPQSAYAASRQTSMVVPLDDQITPEELFKQFDRPQNVVPLPADDTNTSSETQTSAQEVIAAEDIPSENLNTEEIISPVEEISEDVTISEQSSVIQNPFNDSDTDQSASLENDFDMSSVNDLHDIQKPVSNPFNDEEDDIDLSTLANSMSSQISVSEQPAINIDVGEEDLFADLAAVLNETVKEVENTHSSDIVIEDDDEFDLNTLASQIANESEQKNPFND